jgi:hypothetical protein
MPPSRTNPFRRFPIIQPTVLAAIRGIIAITQRITHFIIEILGHPRLPAYIIKCGTTFSSFIRIFIGFFRGVPSNFRSMPGVKSGWGAALRRPPHESF